MIIITDDPEPDKEFLEFKEKYLDKLVEANNGDVARAVVELNILYRSIPKNSWIDFGASADLSFWDFIASSEANAPATVVT